MKTIQGTDIYLLDQILKGTYQPTDKILDAGCGRGRNMRWFAINNRAIYGCDRNPDIVAEAVLYTGVVAERLLVSAVEKMPYQSKEFDHLICNAVLHFAESTAHFIEMVSELGRVLKPGGTLFIRMTSTFGLPKNYVALGDGRFLLQDGSERFLLTQELLKRIKKELGFEQIEPVKSVLVEELRSMTTLVLRKM